MVECESEDVEQVMTDTLVLIDTWWNVNNLLFASFHIHASVLIDTWWNVNLLNLRTLPESEMVLIDTWWNVNYPVLLTNERTHSFNRYMVECEYTST